MNIEKVQEKLQAVKALFIQRYRLQPSDESAGLRAIDRAIAAGRDVSIANLRGALAQYELYPQYGDRIAALLTEAERAMAEPDEEAESAEEAPTTEAAVVNPEPEESPATAQVSEAPVTATNDAAPADPEPEAPTPIKANATRVSTPKSRGK